MLLHTIDAMAISVVLIMGDDRLYSMLTSRMKKQQQELQQQQQQQDDGQQQPKPPKVIKLPRSGGVASRDPDFRRHIRSVATRRYFYGDNPSLTPFLAHVPFANLTLYKPSSVALSASLLPVAATQSTEAVQLTRVDITEQLQHSLLAVCHPSAVQKYEETGSARDLYAGGVAGFVLVERVLMDTDMLHLLSPCAGNLPSYTLLVGDITWME